MPIEDKDLKFTKKWSWKIGKSGFPVFRKFSVIEHQSQSQLKPIMVQKSRGSYYQAATIAKRNLDEQLTMHTVKWLDKQDKARMSGDRVNNMPSYIERHLLDNKVLIRKDDPGAMLADFAKSPSASALLGPMQYFEKNPRHVYALDNIPVMVSIASRRTLNILRSAADGAYGPASVVAPALSTRAHQTPEASLRSDWTAENERVDRTNVIASPSRQSSPGSEASTLQAPSLMRSEPENRTTQSKAFEKSTASFADSLPLHHDMPSQPHSEATSANFAALKSDAAGPAGVVPRSPSGDSRKLDQRVRTSGLGIG